MNTGVYAAVTYARAHGASVVRAAVTVHPGAADEREVVVVPGPEPAPAAGEGEPWR